jgi:Ca-activated chloride channel family protein
MEQADLAMVIALDGSASVSLQEFDLMTRGLGWALRDASVIAGLTSGPAGASLCALLLWAGVGQQDVLLGWTRIGTIAAAHAFADAVENAPRSVPAGGTAIGEALIGALGLLTALPARAGRHIIDVVGDGRTNEGRPPAPVRDRLAAIGVTINGLCVLNEEPDLLDYYRAEVIGGPGAFALACADYEDFAQAMREKLLREARAAPAV